MKMNFKLKVLAAVAILAASGPALATVPTINDIDGKNGNGDLLLNVRFYDANTANEISGVFDLGVTLSSVLAQNNVAGVGGYNQSWDLTSAPNYSASWNTLTSFISSHGGNLTDAHFNVIALNSLTPNTKGGVGYLTTMNTDAYPSLSNASLKGFSNMQLYIDANGTALATTHSTTDVFATDNSFFGQINGSGLGDTWLAKTGDTGMNVGGNTHLFYLTTSSTASLAQSSKTAFGYDLSGDHLINPGSSEFTNVALGANGVLTISSPSVAAPIPEANTWAMMLAGLGMLGMMVRRRNNV